MSDFDELSKMPPIGVADVLRRLGGTPAASFQQAPVLTLHLTSGSKVAGYLLQFKRDHVRQFIVTVGHFRAEDGSAEAVTYVPMDRIESITVHAPTRLAEALSQPLTAGPEPIN